MHHFYMIVGGGIPIPSDQVLVLDFSEWTFVPADTSSEVLLIKSFGDALPNSCAIRPCG